MSDQIIQPPAAAGQFQQAASQALAEARSPMEAMADQNFAREAGMPNPVVPPDFTSNLEKARQADTQRANDRVQPKPAAPVEQQQERQSQQQAEPADENASPLDWKPKGPKPSEHWEKLKSERDELKAKYEQLTKNPQAAAADLTKHPEYAKLKAERDEFYNIVKDVAVERDPEFKAKFEPKVEAAIKAAKFAAGGNADKLEKLLRKEGSPERDLAIEELLKDSSESTKRRINAALMHLDQIDIERQSEIAHRKANFETRQLDQFKQQESAIREKQQKIEHAYTEISKQWTDPKEGMPFLVKRDGDDRWNQSVDESLELAQHIFKGELDANELAKASMWAAVGPRAVDGWQEAVNKIASLNAFIEKHIGAMPGDSNGAPRSGGGVVREVTNPLEYHDQFSSGLAAARAQDANGRGY